VYNHFLKNNQGKKGRRGSGRPLAACYTYIIIHYFRERQQPRGRMSALGGRLLILTKKNKNQAKHAHV
jgi:hypothetical protein